MRTNKTLSIVLPTYNRADYLSVTLDSFVHQMECYNDDVSFIVCNNASTDNTPETIENYHEKYPFFEYINFTEHVPVGYSLSRAIDQANGEYVMLWGDDDFPAPFMVSMLLETIQQSKGASLIHFNRLCGFDNQIRMVNKLSVVNNNTGWNLEHYSDTNSFLQKYVIDLTFMSSFAFKKTAWGGV